MRRTRAYAALIGLGLGLMLLAACHADPTGPTALELPPLERSDSGLIPAAVRATR